MILILVFALLYCFHLDDNWMLLSRDVPSQLQKNVCLVFLVISININSKTYLISTTCYSFGRQICPLFSGGLASRVRCEWVCDWIWGYLDSELSVQPTCMTRSCSGQVGTDRCQICISFNVYVFSWRYFW